MMLKKLSLITFLVTLTLGGGIAFAQENPTHLDFKGIPIDGNLESYTSQLNQLGFTTTKVTDDAAMMKGSFAGEDVEVAVYTTSRSKTVYMVVVAFPEQTSWYSIKSDFKKLENNLQVKYGKPTLQRKSFSSPYYEGDGYEMTAIKVDKCNYYTRFTTATGELTLLILKSGQLGLYYVDKINDATYDREKNASIYEDL
ncbi:MAG: hypothetical protein J6X79_01160 [Bacteroidales bacterium]|nr:hypothetical protein [Bacteroidales bacterium]